MSKTLHSLIWNSIVFTFLNHTVIIYLKVQYKFKSIKMLNHKN